LQITRCLKTVEKPLTPADALCAEQPVEVRARHHTLNWEEQIELSGSSETMAGDRQRRIRTLNEAAVFDALPAASKARTFLISLIFGDEEPHQPTS
jgi:hypothetical protein